MTNPLYYESHITIEPGGEEDRKEIEEIIRGYGFKLAELLMKKRDNDTPERSKFDTFCTGHGTHIDQLSARMYSCVKHLQEDGFKVWRYKIESVVIDSKHTDVLNLLPVKGGIVF